MTYAYNLNKDLVFIDSVPNGKNCNCTCPACGESLIARNEGKKKEHHFAHIGGTECEHALQTMVHLLAKEIFVESKSVLIPVLFNDTLFFKNYKVTKAIEELKVGNIQPDIVLDCDGLQFFIEIYVTHAIDDEKKEKLKSKPYTTIEYDLSKIDRHITKENLTRILFESPKIKFYYDYDSVRIYNKAIFIKEYGNKLTPTNNNKILNCPRAMLRNTRTQQTEQCIIDYNICSYCNYFSGFISEENSTVSYCGRNIDDISKLDLRVYNGIKQVKTNSEVEIIEKEFRKAFLDNANKNTKPFQNYRIKRKPRL